MLPKGWVSNSHSFCKQTSTSWEHFRALNGKVRKSSKHFTAFTSVFVPSCLEWRVLVMVCGAGVEQEPLTSSAGTGVAALVCASLKWRICYFLLFILSTDFLFMCRGTLSDVQAGSELFGVPAGQSWGHWPVPYPVLICHSSFPAHLADSFLHFGPTCTKIKLFLVSCLVYISGDELVLVYFNTTSVLKCFFHWKTPAFLAVLKAAFAIRHKPYFRQFNLFKMRLKRKKSTTANKGLCVLV